jgi:bacteriorhodopsin
MSQIIQENFSEEKQSNGKTVTIKSDNHDYFVKFTFYITYVFLLTTGTITFIESMRTSDSKVRHILNLETCISVVAAFFYSKFIADIEDKETNKLPLDYKSITLQRYTDWMITTPIMLLVLCLAFVYNNKQSLNFFTFLIILLLNYAMLISGFAGETGIIQNTNLTQFMGFFFFAILFGFLYVKFLSKKNNFDNKIIYYSFLILWAFYGIFYNMDHEFRNIGYNVLDLLAKCFVGIFFWAYFTNVFTL